MKAVRFLLAATVALLLALATAPPARADVDLYTTPGEHSVNGREWRTMCEPYSVTERCRTEIFGSTVKRTGRGYVVVNDWMFNNLTYVAAPYSVWLPNTLSQSFDRLGFSGGGDRTWRSECFTALTGRGCRGWVEATVIETHRQPNGNNAYRQVKKWVLNHMIRFDSSPISPHFGKVTIGCERVPGGRNVMTDIVDPDNLGYNVTFLTDAGPVTIDTAPGTRTVKHFQPNLTCDDYWGAVNLG